MKTQDLHRHVCSITGKGMSEGFVINDEYIKDEENLIKELRTSISSFNADINIGYSESYEGDDSLGGGLIPTTISDENLKNYSYENDYYYWTEWYDFQDLEDEEEGYDDDGNLYEFKNNKWVKFSIKKEHFYTLDMVCTGNHKADYINSRIMEFADDIAEHKAQKDWEADDRAENFYIEEANGDLRMNAEAQDIYNEYYDEEVDRLYRLVNRCIEIHES